VPNGRNLQGRMMKKHISIIALAVSGLILMALVVLIIIEPPSLVWVIVAALLFIGAMIFLIRRFIRKIGKQIRRLT
jgi:hypothetical protein